MKILFVIVSIVIFVQNSYATERVTMVCKFNAIAAGYVDKSYSVNLIMEDRKFYNADGTSGDNQQSIYGSGSTDWSNFSFYIYDGNSYRGLITDRFIFNTEYHWTLNTGEFACSLNRGWRNSYYHDDVKVIRDTTYISKKEYVVIHDTIDRISNNECVVSPKRDTVIKIVHDTVVKIVKDSILDSSKATQRFSLRGKYVALAANETDCEFYTRFLKYNDSVFNENGEYVDSFEIKLLYLSGSYYKTIKLERAILMTIIGHPAIYPTRKGNYYVLTERNWNEESVKDWSKVKVSQELQKEIDKLRSEIGK